ncbi:MAG: 1,4-dihydroxy-2-naphthoate octaprenyltransferase [Muribaculaceae bacterium]|nr:1,4-dihydroxy-2-naphthoate octaprenyltransferase [Muribaculaceae bacterium]
MRNNTDKTIPPRHPWIEAMRLRTLPAGVAGVICGSGVALALNNFQWLPALICLIFSLLAQIASNFANEYFDYRNGLDRKGREGFRRGVTEGDISPRAMLYATSGTLAAACLVGLTLIYWGGWILIPIGILIAIFALMYSAGPYPLSHHGLGDLAVIIFFGIVPVTLTAWLQYRVPSTLTAALLPAIGTGLLASNILIVNNYRDVEDDRAVSKHTTVVIFGRKVMSWVYLSNVVLGIALICGPMAYLNGNNIIRTIILVFSLIALASGISIRSSMLHSEGRQLNDILKRTAILLLLVTVTVTLLSAF